jgi:hypothetical protein
MPRGTNVAGDLAFLDNCQLVTPCGTICFKILPDITDAKGANYAQENAPGRSSPLINFAYSEPRNINTEFHFMITTTNDINYNWRAVRIIQSLVYPQPPTSNLTAPFIPPPVVKFVCGDLMDGASGLCLILRNYTVRWPTDVAWESQTYLPYKFSISCSWEVVYACQDLPDNTCACTQSGNDECTGPCDDPTTSCTTITGVTTPTVGQASGMRMNMIGMPKKNTRSTTLKYIKRGMWNG